MCEFIILEFESFEYRKIYTARENLIFSTFIIDNQLITLFMICSIQENEYFSQPNALSYLCTLPN